MKSFFMIPLLLVVCSVAQAATSIPLKCSLADCPAAEPGALWSSNTFDTSIDLNGTVKGLVEVITYTSSGANTSFCATWYAVTWAADGSPIIPTVPTAGTGPPCTGHGNSEFWGYIGPNNFYVPQPESYVPSIFDYSNGAYSTQTRSIIKNGRRYWQAFLNTQ